MQYLSREQVRRVDQIAIQRYGMAGLVLMENAGRGCADVLEKLGIAGPVLICCGKGNNGGDGLVVARHLLVRGHTPRVLLGCEGAALSGDAAANFSILQRMAVEIQVARPEHESPVIETWFQEADWIVDAMLGTGTRGQPRPPFDDMIRWANMASARTMAIDLPSGLDCDTGQAAAPTFRADHTCTLVAPKIGFRMASAAACLGQVHILDIGAPTEVIEAARNG